jgi:hypothetical protein
MLLPNKTSCLPDKGYFTTVGALRVIGEVAGAGA